MNAVPETPREGGNDPSAFMAALERGHGAETLWSWVKDWIMRCRIDRTRQRAGQRPQVDTTLGGGGPLEERRRPVA
jgi:hypothetical protein